MGLAIAFLEILWETSVCHGMVWPSWQQVASWPISTATVEEPRVLTAAGRHLAASVVGEQRQGELGLVSPFRTMFV